MQRKKIVLGFCSIILFLSLIPLLPVQAQEVKNGDITFEPNVVPELRISFVEELFRFQWLENRFDLKLLINCENKNLSLRDFWEKTDRLVKWNELITKATDSMYEFGYMITDIPQEIADNCEFLVWKIEGASFNISEIELLELGENDTKIFLPDNLCLSYEDIWLKGFEVTHPSKSETKVCGVKGKTKWDLDPITYSDPTITVTDNLSSDANWYVWNASNVNGWGAVFNYDNMTYFYNSSKLKIASGGTFIDEDVQMVFNTTSEIAIFNDSSNFQLGTLEDSANKVTSGGVSVLFDLAGGANDVAYYADAGSVTKFYGCTMTSQSHQSRIYVYHSSSYAYLYNTMFVGLVWQMYQPHADIYRFTQTAQSLGSGVGVYDIYSSDANFSDISVSGNQYAIYGATGTITNCVARNNTYIIYCWSASHPNAYLVNSDVDVWNVYLISNYVNEVFRQYTFDLTTLFPNQTAVTDCNVSLTDVDNTELFNIQTDANGQITQQTVTYGFYNQTGGNTIYLKSPHTLKVFKKGVRMYQSVFNITDKTDLTLTLSPRAWSPRTQNGSITYASNAITVTNFTENNPCTFQDIVDVNDENGWGMVDAIGTNMFFFEQCTLEIGNWSGGASGSPVTYFEDKSVQVTFGNGEDWFIAVEVDANATAIFGELVDAETKTTRRGCSFIFYYTDGFECWRHSPAPITETSNVYFYDCKFTGLPDTEGGELENYAGIYFEGNGTMYNSIVSFMAGIGVGQSGGGQAYDFYNVQCSNLSDYGIYFYQHEEANIDQLEIRDAWILFHLNAKYNNTLLNLYGRNASDYAFRVSDNGDNANYYLVNPDFDSWTFTWFGSGSIISVYRQYTFDLTVTYPDGTVIDGAIVTIKHYGQSEAQDFTGTTDSNGQIPQQTLSMGFYNQTGANTIYNYNPYNIEIIGVTGYQDYNNNFTLGEQTEWTIALTPTVPELFDSTYYLLGGLSFLPISLLFAFLLRRKQDADRL